MVGDGGGGEIVVGDGDENMAGDIVSLKVI